MTADVAQLKVFVAFTNECQEQRDLVHRIVQEAAVAALRRELSVSIDVFDWASVSPDVGRPQHIINTPPRRQPSICGSYSSAVDPLTPSAPGNRRYCSRWQSWISVCCPGTVYQ